MAPRIEDQIIDACEIRGREEVVYCLGPFARRVSFTAQQNRALNLVWALSKVGRIAADKRVAVIGAGVAGLTAAAGFIAYGCKVDVFEFAADTVSKQRRTKHRLVHPTINQWPKEKIKLTTELPFLEWSAGQCSDVSTSIAKQFDELKGSSRVFTDHSVTQITDVATGLVRLKVTPLPDNPRSYHIVLIAIGFGEEKPSDPFEPVDYWFPDGLETLRFVRKVPDFLVSGCGDGGLIDTLRLVHKDFESGQLAYDVARMLWDTGIARRIFVAESTARLSGNTNGLQGAYMSSAEEIEENLDYEKIKELLNNSIYKTPNVVYLIDSQLDAPFSLNSAPIHKLMVAHARHVGAVVYRRGSAQLQGAEVLFSGIRIPAPDKSKVIVRHGPQERFDRLLSESEVKSLQIQQHKAPDFLAEPQWEGTYPVPSPLRERDLRDPEFIDSRVKFARKVVRGIADEADIAPLVGKLRAIYRGAIPVNAPDELFGIPVESTVLPRVRGL